MEYDTRPCPGPTIKTIALDCGRSVANGRQYNQIDGKSREAGRHSDSFLNLRRPVFPTSAIRFAEPADYRSVRRYLDSAMLGSPRGGGGRAGGRRAAGKGDTRGAGMAAGAIADGWRSAGWPHCGSRATVCRRHLPCQPRRRHLVCQPRRRRLATPRCAGLLHSVHRSGNDAAGTGPAAGAAPAAAGGCPPGSACQAVRRPPVGESARQGAPCPGMLLIRFGRTGSSIFDLCIPKDTPCP